MRLEVFFQAPFLTIYRVGYILSVQGRPICFSWTACNVCVHPFCGTGIESGVDDLWVDQSCSANTLKTCAVTHDHLVIPKTTDIKCQDRISFHDRGKSVGIDLQMQLCTATWVHDAYEARFRSV